MEVINFMPPATFVRQTLFGKLMSVRVKKVRKHGIQIKNIKCIGKTLKKDKENKDDEVMTSSK